MSKPFHLTLTDNTTGEIMHDIDIDALLASAHVNEDETRSITVANCDTLAIAQTIHTLRQIYETLRKENPELAIFEAVVDAKEHEIIREAI